LANVANLISNLKNLYNEANSYEPGSTKDNKFTTSFINRLNMLEKHLKNDGWLSTSSTSGNNPAPSLYSEVSTAITNILNIVGSKTSPGLSLATIWQQATPGNPYQPIGSFSFNTSNAICSLPCNLGDNGQGFLGNLRNLAASLDFSDPQSNITYSNGYLTFNIKGLGKDTNGDDAIAVFLESSGGNYYLPTAWNNYMERMGWPAQNSENLQTMLQSFDTINSSTTSLSASYQGEEQYNSSQLQQMGGTLSSTQNTLIQMLSTLNSNTKNQ